MKKTKTKKIPVMTQKRLIEETNKNSWEILQLLQNLSGEAERSIKGLYNLLLDTFDYGDKLRCLIFQYFKYPSEANKTAVLKLVGEMHKISERMEHLQFLERKHNHLDTEERENGELN